MTEPSGRRALVALSDRPVPIDVPLGIDRWVLTALSVCVDRWVLTDVSASVDREVVTAVPVLPERAEGGVAG